MLWTLDVYAVAQALPGTAGVLLSTPGKMVNASASAALLTWLKRYVQEQCITAAKDITGSNRNCDRAVQYEPNHDVTALLPFLRRCEAALAAGQVRCAVCVVLLRVPTAYTVLCCEGAVSQPGSSPRNVCPLAGRVAGSSAHLFFPSCVFRSAAPPVHVMGVVHGVWYESRAATRPAPWVTLLILHPYTYDTPKTCDVDLTGLFSDVIQAVAVLGAVVELRGTASLAQCRQHWRQGEVCREAYIVASWAAVLLRAESTRCSGGARAVGRATPASLAAAHRGSSNGRADTALLSYARSEYDATTSALLSEDALLVEGVPDWEEEAAARVALGCWEGTRLALGLGSDSSEETLVGTPLFAATLDVIVAAQLTLFSAQLPDGVVMLLTDESPDSLVDQMQRALRAVAPPTAVAVDVAPTELYRAKPSYFLPSYKVHSGPAATAAATTAPTNIRPTVRHYSSGGFSSSSPATQLPTFQEELSGGVLTRAAGRALVLPAVESIPVRTLNMLREALRPRSGADEDAEGAARALGREATDGFASPYAEETRETASRDASAATACVEGRRHVVQRDGGQLARYYVAHAALCTVRDGNALTTKSHLFEFAQRCDVVLVPAFVQLRQTTTVYASLAAPFQSLLQSRRALWLRLLGQLYELPTALDEETQSGAARADVAPTLSEPCNRLLSLYFIAAKAVCPEGADASMMSTLVKLTLTHAQWRWRLTDLQRQLGSRSQSMSRGGREAPPAATSVTALIDAVVAVGLCDATLYFFTAKTLLGECVFHLLEREAWPAWEAQAAAAHTSAADVMQGECESMLAEAVPPDIFPAVRQLCEEVEYRTRAGAASCSESCTAPPAPVFSICGLVDDLVGHLERLVQSSAAPEKE